MYKPLKNFHKRTVVPKSKISVDCSKLVADEILNCQEMGEYVIDKLNSTKKILKNTFKFIVKGDRIVFDSNVPMGKRCIKEYAKKYLHVNGLKDYVRVLAENKGSYALRYYRIQEEEKDE